MKPKLQFLTLILLASATVTNSFFQLAQKTSNAQLFPSPSTSTSSFNDAVPYVIQKVDNSDKEIKDICKVTIQVFFNEDAEESAFSKKKFFNTPIWKSAQLAYLRNLQYSDLRMRKFMGYNKQNDMFVARKVIVAQIKERRNDEDDEIPEEIEDDLILNAYALPELQNGQIYTLGEIVGFCEVSARMFSINPSQEKSNSYRPLLTNLAVKSSARRSGIGSELVRACEDAVSKEWKPSYDEIVLQVEDDNDRGLRFYQKLGYEYVFADPSTRRYDTSGIFLKEVPSTKICMRKSLKTISETAANNGQKFRSFFSVDKFLNTLKSL